MSDKNYGDLNKLARGRAMDKVRKLLALAGDK
jgi:hypothetical protein